MDSVQTLVGTTDRPRNESESLRCCTSPSRTGLAPFGFRHTQIFCGRCSRHSVAFSKCKKKRTNKFSTIKIQQVLQTGAEYPVGQDHKRPEQISSGITFVLCAEPLRTLKSRLSQIEVDYGFERPGLRLTHNCIFHEFARLIANKHRDILSICPSDTCVSRAFSSATVVKHIQSSSSFSLRAGV